MGKVINCAHISHSYLFKCKLVLSYGGVGLPTILYKATAVQNTVRDGYRQSRTHPVLDIFESWYGTVPV